ncbi:HTH domain-containing protein [Caulobacter sp. BK020]|uniref:HTH domain-containing protein n=1 Tax=Caulobacter sp. BK020 TaxID=2512117 RepID=UPI001044F6EF|nr:HTH domain-containing protein [Caulobacter sp. BK020]
MPTSKAEADLARAQAEIRRLEGQLQDARARAVKIAHYIEMAKLYESGASPLPETKRGSGGRAVAAAQMAVEVLREERRPLHTRELLEALGKRGLVFDSQNPITNLSSALSRSDELIADRSTGWKLREWAKPKSFAEFDADDLDDLLGTVSNAEPDTATDESESDTEEAF